MSSVPVDEGVDNLHLVPHLVQVDAEVHMLSLVDVHLQTLL